MTSKKLCIAPSLFERSHKPQEDWDYIQDPTYSKSIDSHVCMTCMKFDYSNKSSYGPLLFCKWHQKLISHGEHLTHSCEFHQKKLLPCKQFKKNNIFHTL